MFSDPDRLVFPYHDGKGVVYADPLAVDRKLRLALGGDAARILRESSPTDEHGVARAVEVWGVAAGQLAEAVRSAFAMQPFDPATGQGATERHCLAAVDALLEWLEKNGAPAAS